MKLMPLCIVLTTYLTCHSQSFHTDRFVIEFFVPGDTLVFFDSSAAMINTVYRDIKIEGANNNEIIERQAQIIGGLEANIQLMNNRIISKDERIQKLELQNETLLTGNQVMIDNFNKIYTQGNDVSEKIEKVLKEKKKPIFFREDFLYGALTFFFIGSIIGSL